MNAYSSFASALPTAPGILPGAGRPEFGQASASTMGMKWSALHDAAGIVATLAGLAAEPVRAEIRNFPAVMRDAGGSRRDLAEQGVDDLAVMMEPGLAALLAVHARGINPAPAALALWQEFHAGRNAVLALAQAPGAPAPRRPT